MRTTQHGTVTLPKELLNDLKKAKKQHNYIWTPEMDLFIKTYYKEISNDDMMKMMAKHFNCRCSQRTIYLRHKKLVEEKK